MLRRAIFLSLILSHPLAALGEVMAPPVTTAVPAAQVPMLTLPQAPLPLAGAGLSGPVSAGFAAVPLARLPTGADPVLSAPAEPGSAGARAMLAGAPASLTPSTAPEPSPTTIPDLRCTDDRRSCIRAKEYVSDVCTVIERAAGENGLDPSFLARLLWKESMFEPSAISPVGAQGIAQFMPGTARLRGLDDPFNPAKAIHASAAYLRDLIAGFGNIGMAAVAYNGGEGRASSFRGGNNALPFETQDYVLAITGHDAWKWRDNPPVAGLDLRLDKARDFLPACITLAGRRTLREFATPQHAWPWGVILAAHPKQSGVNQQISVLNRRLRPILGGKRVSYVRKKMSGSGRTMFTAQLGYSSRGEANAFCERLKSLGGRCIVLKN